MKVRDVYERSVLAIEASESLSDAIVRMNNHAIGALAVYSAVETVGIVTERDVVRALAEGADPSTTMVEDCMTSGVVIVTPGTDLMVAAGRMVRLGARHLPVVDEVGRVIGMLSARDLVMVLVGDGPDALAG